MKKFYLIILVLLLFQVASINKIYASSLSDKINSINLEFNLLDSFTIKSGFSKESEVTFDSSRTITGSALENTEIVISVYQEKNNKLELIKEYSLEVGKSGIYSQDIKFRNGVNHIFITAEYKNNFNELYFEINRLETKVKNNLENLITLPGIKK